MKFNRGDFVFLNSGSSPLTVLGYINNDVVVYWMSNSRLNHMCIHEVCLTKDKK